jgi:UrcA family protein
MKVLLFRAAMAACVLTAAGSTAALAEPGHLSWATDQTPQVRLVYGDLDPGRDHDRRVLQARVREAASNLCRQELGARPDPGDTPVCELQARVKIRAALPAHTRAALTPAADIALAP